MSQLTRGTAKRGRPGPLAVTRVVWQFGDRWSRLLLTALITVFGSVVFGLAWLTVLFLQGAVLPSAYLGYMVANTSVVMFRGPWDDAMYNVTIIEEYLRRGWWRPESTPYFSERARYLRAWGRDGRFRGAFGWGILALALYLTLVGVAVPIVTNLAITSGQAGFLVFFAVTVIVSCGFFAATGLRNKRLHLEADARGFHLVSLYPRKPRGSASWYR